NNWRASLVPAAAVIPAPIAYIKVVAVKKLVVEFRGSTVGRANKSVLDGGPVLLVSESPLTSAKAFAKDVFINQERKLGDRRRSDTVCLGSGGSMVARLKLKGIDGRAPPGLFLDSMGGGAWPFLVGGVICLVNSDNERDLNLLNSQAILEWSTTS
ncbi:4935_t:CDS:2, partial [Scutellospora calospora]